MEIGRDKIPDSFKGEREVEITCVDKSYKNFVVKKSREMGGSWRGIWG